MAKFTKKPMGRPKGSVNKTSMKGRKGRPKWAPPIEDGVVEISLEDLDLTNIKDRPDIIKRVQEQIKSDFNRGKYCVKELAELRGRLDNTKTNVQDEGEDLDRLRLAQQTLKQAAFNKRKAPHHPNRTKNGFTEGNKHSPGRPLGSKRKVIVELERIGEDNSVEALEQIISWMKSGNMEATKFLLDRVYPVRKDVKRYLGYEGEYETLEDINKLSTHVIKMMAEGEISADDAYGYGKICEQRMKVIVDAAMVGKYAELKALVDNIAGIRKG